MALLSMCIPILPGKKDKWQEMMNNMNEAPLKAEMDKSREEAGVHERSFLQETPNGNFVILTFEGENPAEGFGKIMAAADENFAEFALDVHGLDMKGPAPSLPQLVYDSRA
jgi:hypothetical protein